ncbi:MAG TPA: hypothetical protein DCM05_16205 [Elusimicrobia bacterium]|nr:hypothetical protein [Elusimicrobiota bacterium]
MAEKTESLLAALRGLPPPEAPPAADAAAAPAATEEQLAPLRSKIDELERKLAEMAAPPPPAEEELTPPEPPKPPTELTLFLHTRVELLERRLELAQQEALRANLVLREREEAQRKAQKEVEELFKTLREQERTARFDKRLREQTAATQARVEDMGARLAMAELKMIPAEEVLAWLEKEGSLEAVRERLQERLSKLAPEGEPQPGAPPQPPSPSLIGKPTDYEQTGPIAAAMARVADLERRLEEAEEARKKEREDRAHWESGVLQTLRRSGERWERAGGAGLLVEATLQSMVDLLGKRDACAQELAKTLERLEGEPPGSTEAPALRARAKELRKSIESLQPELDKAMAVVNAWVERSQRKDT